MCSLFQMRLLQVVGSATEQSSWKKVVFLLEMSVYVCKIAINYSIVHVILRNACLFFSVAIKIWLFTTGGSQAVFVHLLGPSRRGAFLVFIVSCSSSSSSCCSDLRCESVSTSMTHWIATYAVLIASSELAWLTVLHHIHEALDCIMLYVDCAILTRPGSWIFMTHRITSCAMYIFRWYIGSVGGANNFCLQKSRIPTGRIGIFIYDIEQHPAYIMVHEFTWSLLYLL